MPLTLRLLTEPVADSDNARPSFVVSVPCPKAAETHITIPTNAPVIAKAQRRRAVFVSSEVFRQGMVEQDEE